MTEIIHNMPFSEYVEAEGINASSIKTGRTSMLHMHSAMTGVYTPPTPAMRLGVLIHTRCLEPLRYADEVVLWEGKTQRGKSWDEFKDDNDGKTIVTPSAQQLLEDIYGSVSSHPEAMQIIAETQKEVSMFWESPDVYGLGKARVDMLKPNELWADLKSTSKIHPREFQSHAEKMGYFHQAGWSAEGMNRMDMSMDISYYIVAIESSAPFDVVVYDISDEVLGAREECRKIATEYRLAVDKGIFDGVAPDGIQTLRRPDWAKPKEEDWVIK